MAQRSALEATCGVLSKHLRGIAQHRFIRALMHGYRLAHGPPPPPPPPELQPNVNEAVDLDVDLALAFSDELDPDIYSPDGGVLKASFGHYLKGVSTRSMKELIEALQGLESEYAPLLAEDILQSPHDGKRRIAYRLTPEGYPLVCQAMFKLYHWVCEGPGPEGRPQA